MPITTKPPFAAALLAAGAVLLNAAGEAATPSKKQWIPTVGSGSGVGGAQWRTTVWVHNPSIEKKAGFVASFSERVAYPSLPPQMSPVFWLEPGETRVSTDMMSEFINRTGYGAVSFESDNPIVVRSRIFNANSPTPSGPGTSGQAFDGIDESLAVGLYQAAVLQGVPLDASFRYNFGFVEVVGGEVTVKAERLDSLGQPADPPVEKEYSIGAKGAQQFPVSDLGPAPSSKGTDPDQIRPTVVGGTGRIIAFGSLVDNTTGDPTTITPRMPRVRPGKHNIAVVRKDGVNAGVITIWVEFGPDGKMYETGYLSTISVECNDKFATSRGGGGIWDPPISLYAERHQYVGRGRPPSVELFNGDTVSWDDTIDLYFLPDGTVVGTDERVLKTSTGVFPSVTTSTQNTLFAVLGWEKLHTAPSRRLHLQAR